jgi:hypothetical protein
MKKATLLLCLALIGLTASSQWTHKVINSEFDGKFKKAFTKIDNGGFLAMEVGEIPIDTTDDRYPFMYIMGVYFCDEGTTIEMALYVGKEIKKYDIRATKSNDSRTYYFNDDMWTPEFVSDFKKASKCSIRVNQDYCTTDYFSFNMTGSTDAFNFISRK